MINNNIKRTFWVLPSANKPGDGIIDDDVPIPVFSEPESTEEEKKETKKRYLQELNDYWKRIHIG